MSIISKIKMPGMADAYDIGVDWENVKDKPDVGSIDVGVTNEILNIDTNNDIAVSGSSSGPQEQADYDENDITANSYIKNRPFMSVNGGIYSPQVNGTQGEWAGLYYTRLTNYIPLNALKKGKIIGQESSSTTLISSMEAIDMGESSDVNLSDMGYNGTSFIWVIDSNSGTDAPVLISLDDSFYLVEDGMTINFPQEGTYIILPTQEGEENKQLEIPDYISVNTKYKSLFDNYSKSEIQSMLSNYYAKTEITYGTEEKTDSVDYLPTGTIYFQYEE